MAITISVFKVLGAYHLYIIPSRCPNPFSQATQTCRVLPLSFFLWLVALHLLRLPLLLLSRQNEERQRKYPLWGDRAVSSPCSIIHFVLSLPRTPSESSAADGEGHLDIRISPSSGVNSLFFRPYCLMVATSVCTCY